MVTGRERKTPPWSEPARAEPEHAAPESGTRSVQVARTLREIVSAYAKEELADELIHEALADAGLATLPSTAAALRELIEVELRHAVQAALGADAAEAVLTGLEPMLQVLERIDRRPSSPPTIREPIGRGLATHPAKMARVAILTDDARLAIRVRVALGHGQELARYRSFEELGERGRVHTNVIVDCRLVGGADGLATSAVDAIGALTRSDVLLLFAGVSERTALRRVCPGAGVIVCSTRDVDDVELAELLTTFVGSP